jgi:hypothetical protein
VLILPDCCAGCLLKESDAYQIHGLLTSSQYPDYLRLNSEVTPIPCPALLCMRLLPCNILTVRPSLTPSTLSVCLFALIFPPKFQFNHDGLSLFSADFFPRLSKLHAMCGLRGGAASVKSKPYNNENGSKSVQHLSR